MEKVLNLPVKVLRIFFQKYVINIQIFLILFVSEKGFERENILKLEKKFSVKNIYSLFLVDQKLINSYRSRNGEFLL